ncbi:hypothetical protein ACWD7F_36860 [Streptomyces sp. NPDC005122]
MSSLTDPLDEAQQCLIDIVWSTLWNHSQWPAFFYVEYQMRQNGYDDAVAVLNSFPTAGTLLTRRYRAVGWWGADHLPDTEGRVFLTMAGLYHVGNGREATKVVADSLLGFMSECNRARDGISKSPFTMPNIEVSLEKYAEKENWAPMQEKLVAAVANQEWPGLHFNEHSKQGKFSSLAQGSFSTVEEYLAAVAAALSPPEPPAALPYQEPRALLRALNFLDVTSELILRDRLVVRPPMDRSSLLALDVEDEAGFQAGLVVLTEILRDFKVPGKNPPTGLGRLKPHLVSLLPTIDQPDVEQAVELLDQIRVLRNSTVHPKPDPKLLAAHHALGLTFPIRDFSAAWDSVRAHAERALNRLQEAIQAARP